MAKLQREFIRILGHELAGMSADIAVDALRIEFCGRRIPKEPRLPLAATTSQIITGAAARGNQLVTIAA